MIAVPLVHIGYHKTSTTWLQKHLFVREDMGFAYPFPNRAELTRHLVVVDDFSFDPEEIYEKIFRVRLQELMERHTQIPVISNERFSGFPMSGGHDSKIIADRLKATFGDARVLVVIRAQDTMILSNYLQYVRDGGPCNLRQFLMPPRDLSTRIPTFSLNFFCYHKLVLYYLRIFGHENVRVLVYEEFVRRPRDFVARILAHCELECDLESLAGLPYGVNENRSDNWAFLKWKRQANKLFGARLNPAPMIQSEVLDRRFLSVGRLMSSVERALGLDRRELLQDVRELIGDFYAESNVRTSDLIGEDLSSWGYVTR